VRGVAFAPLRRLVERIKTSDASPTAVGPEREAAPPEPDWPPRDEREQLEEAPEPAALAVTVAAPEPPPEPVLAVSEQSARAILATGPPPVPEPPRPHPKAQPEPESVSVPEPEPEPEPEVEPEPEPEPDPEPEPEPEPEPSLSGAPREWSVWELQRLIRDLPDDRRQEEWAALVLSLRDFARADGMLPVEFDELVRESFGSLLTGGQTEGAAAR
jgi:hypothetical protein